jgi:hypothetical protein
MPCDAAATCAPDVTANVLMIVLPSYPQAIHQIFWGRWQRQPQDGRGRPVQESRLAESDIWYGICREFGLALAMISAIFCSDQIKCMAVQRGKGGLQKASDGICVS